MANEPLALLFGGKERLKTLRLFVSNPTTPFDDILVAEKTKESKSITKKNLTFLRSIGVISPIRFTKDIEKKKNGKIVILKTKVSGFVFNHKFTHARALIEFINRTSAVTDEEVSRRLKSVGKVKLILVAGIFIQNSESRVDVLVVGDGLKKGALERSMKLLEADMGRELRYSAFESADFKYRLDMYDKLVRDVIDYPHRIIVDKIGVVNK